MTFQSNHGLYFSGTYIPFRCVITDIASSFPNCIVTTSVEHAYVIGNQVQFLIPPQWGMVELNNLKGYVIDTTTDTITVDVDISHFSAFVTPTITPPVVVDEPQVLPCGNRNSGAINPIQNQPTLYIPGADRNIFP
jgi:hypothetical protein